MLRLLSGLAVLSTVVAAAACGEAPAPAAARTTRALLEFEGVVDDDGEVTIRTVRPVEAAEGDGERSGLRAMRPGLAQPLVSVREDKNNVTGTAGAPDGIELIVERANGYAAPRIVTLGCGSEDSFEFNITVRNFFATDLTNVFAEVNSVTPADGTHTLCNSDRSTPNLEIDDVPLDTTNGLVRYGNLQRDPNGFATPPAPGTTAVPPPVGTDLTAQTMLWRFRRGAGAFSFRGRVVADVCNQAADCTAGTIANENPTTSTAPSNSFPFGETNGTVETVLEGDGVVYVGGTFTSAGPRTGSAFATLRDDSAAGVALTPWLPFVGGEVHAIAPDGQGGFYAAGDFGQVGNVVKPRLVHIFGDGAIDAGFNPAANLTGTGVVRTLAYDVDNDVLWVGRSLSPFLAVLKGSDGTPAFSPVQPGDQVMDIAIGGAFVVIGGEFNNYVTGNRDKVALFLRTTGALQPFRLSVNGDGNLSVDAVATDGATVWIGGEFTRIGNTNISRLAAAPVSTTGNLLASFAPSANGTVFDLEVIPGTPTIVVAAGAFTTIGSGAGNGRNGLAAVNGTDGTRLGWNPNAITGTNTAAAVDEIALDIDPGNLISSVYVGGAFTTLAGQPRPAGLAALAVPTSSTVVATPAIKAWSPIGGTSARKALAVDPAGGRVLVGGSFTFGGYVARRNVAAFDLASGAVTDLAVANTTTSVRALALAGGALYAGGVQGTQAALFVTPTGAGPQTATSLPVTGASVEALAASSSHVYVGGSFTNLVGQPRTNLGRLTLGSNTTDTWAPAANGTVIALAVDQSTPAFTSDVFVGGAFTNLLGASRFARLRTTSPATLATLPTLYSANGEVRGIDVAKGIVYAVGGFSTIGPASTSRVGAASFDLRDDALTTWNPRLTALFFGIRVGGSAESVAAAGGSAVIGGGFVEVGNQVSRPGVAVVDTVTGAPSPSAPFPAATSGSVRTVGVIGRYFVVGGDGATTAAVATQGTTTARSLRSSLVFLNAD